MTWRRFRHHSMAMAGSAMILLLLAYVTLGGLVFSRGYCAPLGVTLTGEAYANCNDTSIAQQPPSWAHPFGTDTIGRDILARSIFGGQISLLIGITAALLEMVLGVTVGAIAGFFGGWIDSLLMRITESLLVIPQLFLLIVLAKVMSDSIPSLTLFGRAFSGSVIVIVVVIGATSWMYLARIVRAQFMALKELEYVQASRALGISHTRLIFRHLLPNTAAPIIVTATLGVANSILSEAYVSFLGLGIRPPTATWGTMLEDSYRYLVDAPWLWFFPGMLVLLTVLSINFVGDGLRDALDPKMKL
jgi:peptide/nickel transport system permease protein